MIACFCFYECLKSDIKASGLILEASSFLNFPFGMKKSLWLGTQLLVLQRVFCFRLFWSDWESSGIHSVDKDTGGDMMTVAKGLDRPTAFVIFKATPPGL